MFNSNLMNLVEIHFGQPKGPSGEFVGSPWEIWNPFYPVEVRPYSEASDFKVLAEK